VKTPYDGRDCEGYVAKGELYDEDIEQAVDRLESAMNLSMNLIARKERLRSSLPPYSSPRLVVAT
jgi:hypothetical protein